MEEESSERGNDLSRVRELINDRAESRTLMSRLQIQRPFYSYLVLQEEKRESLPVSPCSDSCTGAPGLLECPLLSQTYFHLSVRRERLVSFESLM